MPEQEVDHAQDEALLGHLSKLADELGRTRAAGRLGVDRKTIWRALNAGRLTPRLRESLERVRSEDEQVNAGEDHERVYERVGLLEDRLGEVEQQLEVVQEDLQALRREEELVVVGVEQSIAAAQTHFTPQRLHPEVVTRESLPDDERVFGEAFALVTEWREQAGLFDQHWPQRAGLEAEVRMLELELELVEEHQLTLPPGQLPWDWAQRRSELRQRRQRLDSARKSLRRRRRWSWLVRCLTLGLRV